MTFASNAIAESRHSKGKKERDSERERNGERDFEEVNEEVKILP